MLVKHSMGSLPGLGPAEQRLQTCLHPRQGRIRSNDAQVSGGVVPVPIIPLSLFVPAQLRDFSTGQELFKCHSFEA